MRVENNIIYGGDYNKKFEHASFGVFILNSLRNGGSRESLINAETDLIWTYEDILRETKKYANTFHSFGIEQDDVIAIVAENRHEISAITFAALCLNAVMAPLNFGYTIRELQHSINLVKPKVLIMSEISSKTVSAACKEFKFIKKIINLDRVTDNHQTSINDFHLSYHDSNFDLESFVQKRHDIYTQSAMIFQSSGTTGLPKGCELTQGNLFFTLGQYVGTLSTFKHFKQFNRTLNIAPWFHVIGFASMVIVFLSTQFTSVYLSKFMPRTFLQTIQNYKIVNTLAPPPIVILLAKSPLVDEYDLSSLRLITSGGAPLTEEIENEIQTRFKGNLEIFQCYGMSETFTITCYHRIETPVRQSVGMILKGTHGKVVDLNGNPLGANRVGEFCVKGPNVMKGYLGDPKATAETIDSDGWLHTGDLGYYDENFNFFIVDRLKELIKYKAYQVAPAEIEGLLLAHPKIKDAGVIGIPDESAGELPFAFVVRRQGVDLNELEVADYVAKSVSNPKRLRGGVKFIDEIPKNPSGKILRRVLRELHRASRAKL